MSYYARCAVRLVSLVFCSLWLYEFIANWGKVLFVLSFLEEHQREKALGLHPLDFLGNFPALVTGLLLGLFAGPLGSRISRPFQDWAYPGKKAKAEGPKSDAESWRAAAEAFFAQLPAAAPGGLPLRRDSDGAPLEDRPMTQGTPVERSKARSELRRRWRDSKTQVAATRAAAQRFRRSSDQP